MSQRSRSGDPVVDHDAWRQRICRKDFRDCLIRRASRKDNNKCHCNMAQYSSDNHVEELIALSGCLQFGKVLEQPSNIGVNPCRHFL